MSATLTAASPVIDIEAVDRAVGAAIDAGSARGLRVLGYGEVTLVLGWPGHQPVAAVKRLPVFPDSARFDAYAALVERYVGEISRRGVGVVHTDVRGVDGPRGTVHGYLVQPFAPHEALLNAVLGDAGREREAVLLERIVATVTGCVDERVGLDAQAANWAVEGDAIACLDVSTPMLRTSDGREQLDVRLFLAAYPPAVRPLLARIAPGVMAQYHDPRTVLLDFASNLHKEGLQRSIEPLLRIANERLDRPLSYADVSAYFRRDKLLWATLQRLRLADRTWQRRVRRRPYPFLLPGRYRYGPPATTERQTP